MQLPTAIVLPKKLGTVLLLLLSGIAVTHCGRAPGFKCTSAASCNRSGPNAMCFMESCVIPVSQSVCDSRLQYSESASNPNVCVPLALLDGGIPDSATDAQMTDQNPPDEVFFDVPPPLDRIVPDDVPIVPDIVSTDMVVIDIVTQDIPPPIDVFVPPECSCDNRPCGYDLPAQCGADRCMPRVTACVTSGSAYLLSNFADTLVLSACTAAPFSSLCARQIDGWCKCFGYTSAYGVGHYNDVTGALSVLCFGTQGVGPMNDPASTSAYFSCASTLDNVYTTSACVARADLECRNDELYGGAGWIQQPDTFMQRSCFTDAHATRFPGVLIDSFGRIRQLRWRVFSRRSTRSLSGGSYQIL